MISSFYSPLIFILLPWRSWQTVERQRKLSSLFRHCVWSLPMRCWIRQKRNLERLTVPFFLPWQTILILLSAVFSPSGQILLKNLYLKKRFPCLYLTFLQKMDPLVILQFCTENRGYDRGRILAQIIQIQFQHRISLLYLLAVRMMIQKLSFIQRLM